MLCSQWREHGIVTRTPSIEETIEPILGSLNAVDQGQCVLLNTVLALRGNGTTYHFHAVQWSLSKFIGSLNICGSYRVTKSH